MTTLAHLLVDLLSTAPGLVPLYRAHLALHDALVPELFMGEVARWVAGPAGLPVGGSVPGGAGGEAARELVGVLEAHLTTGDADVRELIAFSFIDTLEQSPAHEVVRLHFGPNLRAQAARRDGWS